ncbi:MAG: gliding motility-associated C-terminal domain-containing protein [bacterium]
MKTIFQIALFTCWYCLSLQAVKGQDAATPICLEVLPEGEVEMTFLTPINTTGFIEYRINYSSGGAVFTQIATLNDVAQNTYLHGDAQANGGSRYYFIETIYQEGVATSDTLQTLFLQLDNVNFNEARLFWNPMSSADPDGSNPIMEIYKEYPEGNWFLLTTIASDNFEYTEPVVVCNDSINYRIERSNINGCRSVSNVNGDWFKITDEPAKPVIDSISINAQENIVIGWETVGNALAYIIYRFESGIWNPIDTVYGAGNTFYEDMLSSPCTKELTYSVATIDTCGSSGPKDENELRKSLRILQAAYDACAGHIELQWNHYRGPDAEKYEVWVSKDDGPFELITDNSFSDTTYIHTLPEIGSAYTYFIRAYFSTGTSTTCHTEINSYTYHKPEYIYLVNADVLQDNSIELTIHADTSVVSSWQIFREQEGTDSELISTLNTPPTGTFPLKFLDADADPGSRQYHYHVRVLDSCGTKALESNDLSTIFLSGSSISENLNQLNWLPLQGWHAGVEKYYIYRIFDTGQPAQMIDSVSGTTNEYVDDLSIFSNLDGIPIYWVEALERTGNLYDYRERARSNRISIVKESEMYMPNAFRPDGISPDFKPVYRFYNGRYFLFQIFNRWGDLIFESNHPDEGWNGTFNGRMVPSGTYVYRLIYETLEAQKINKSGTVTVIY